MATWDLFITGTNTEIGKTHVAAMIARQLAQAGVTVGVYKPVASGCRRENGTLVSDDAELLWEAAGRPATLEAVCPQRFELPVAPPVAARAEGRQIDQDRLRDGLRFWQERSDAVIVEGAGGLLSPLAENFSNADLAADLGLPLLVVAANQLGVINTTLQTLVTASAYPRPLPIAGVVLNQSAGGEGDASLATNAEELAVRCDGLLLGSVVHGGAAFDPPIDWHTAAGSARRREPHTFFG
ncbi:MAG: dethiobiotin synthase [Planctomycetota bacterium]